MRVFDFLNNGILDVAPFRCQTSDVRFQTADGRWEEDGGFRGEGGGKREAGRMKVLCSIFFLLKPNPCFLTPNSSKPASWNLSSGLRH